MFVIFTFFLYICYMEKCYYCGEKMFILYEDEEYNNRVIHWLCPKCGKEIIKHD